MNFERSTDYELIREILTEPRCYRPMGHTAEEMEYFEVGPAPQIDYILAREGARPLAVFLIVQGVEIHFCFVPSVWGHTLPIARAFVAWVWANTDAKVLLGPVPAHNRLALRLACAAGFREYANRGGNVLTEIRRP